MQPGSWATRGIEPSPVLGIHRDRCAGREAEGEAREDTRCAVYEYVPIRFRFRCVFLADGTKRVCIQGVREVRMEKIKASLYIIPVFLEFEGVEILYNM